MQMRIKRTLGIIIGICLLFEGCGADHENTDASRQTSQSEEVVVESAPEEVELDRKEGGGSAGRKQGEKEAENESGMGHAVEGAEKETPHLQMEARQLAQMVEKQSEILEGYRTFLAEYVPQRTGSGSREDPGFALIYLDDDDIPELIVIEGNAHMCGASLYTFEKGETIPVGTYGQYGALHYREKEGIIFDDYDSFGNAYYNVYQIEGTKETLLQSFSEVWEASAGEEEQTCTYTVDGKAVSGKQYSEVYENWYEGGYSEIDYGMCRILTGGSIQEDLTEELENLILRQEEELKQKALLAAKAQESDILLWDYDDYDGDGGYEAFMIVGSILDGSSGIVYKDESLWFAGVDGCTLELDSNGGFRAIDGKMDFGTRKYLFFYLDYNLTANISVMWTVRNGEPVEESGLFQSGQVVYRGENERNEFEIWIDVYDNYCEKDYFGEGDDMWTGHTWKPYFYHYDCNSDRIEAYGGEAISGEAFAKLSGTNLIEEIEAEGCTVGEIIRWENDIVTINYNYVNYVEFWGEDDSWEYDVYENVIWDNNVKDFWRKEERGVTSWENAGVGGSYSLR